MKDKFFIDTNIFIYLHDSSDKKKQECSIKIVNDALRNHHGLISFQVIQEFINVVETKLQVKEIQKNLKYFLSHCMYPLCQVYGSFDLYDLAIDMKRKHKFSFYDSLIIAAAKTAKCSKIYTEDMHPGRFDRSLVIENPFI